MSFIKSFSIKSEKQHPFPFNIPAVRYAREVALGEQVTEFVGDNGCGKSTLLEAIAYSVIQQMRENMNWAGSGIRKDFGGGGRGGGERGESLRAFRKFFRRCVRRGFWGGARRGWRRVC